jgi:hypothetical protein
LEEWIGYMKKFKLTQARQECFLKALAETGSVINAVRVAGTSRTRIYELRKADPAFASAWDDAEAIPYDPLQDEARRRALEGVPQPLVSAGKLVRGDDGQPITIQRYSDGLLLALLKTHQRRQRNSISLPLPPLQSPADPVHAMKAITAGVAAGKVTPAEAADLSKIVQTYINVLQAFEFESRLRELEDNDG